MGDARDSGCRPAGAGWTLTVWHTAFLPFALAAALYLPTLGNGFVWDDEPYLLANPHVAGGLSGASLAWACGEFWQANWHPLTWLSHLIDVELFGLRPAGHHLTSVLLHAANASLLFVLLARLSGARRPSLIAALLFAAHPLRVESVAWVAERKDLLCAFFSLLALGAWLRHLRRPRRGSMAAALILFAAALLSKPMAVSFPFLLVLLDFWPLRRLVPGASGRVLLEKLPFLVLSVASGAVTIAAQASEEAISGSFPLGLRLANALVAYAVYLGKTFLPAGLSFFYPHPGAIPAWRSAGALALLALLTALALGDRRRPYLAVGWCWFLGSLVPVIGLVQVGSLASADRYTYLPQVGILVAAAFLGSSVAGARAPAAGRSFPALVLLAAVCVVALGALTLRQSRSWKSNRTLYEHALAVEPRNWLAHNNLGAEMLDGGDPRGAARHLREAVALNPRLAPAWSNLGKIAFGEGRPEEAGEYFRQALALRPGFGDAENGLGASLLARGRPREAIAHFERARRLAPRDAVPVFNLGAAHAALGDAARAAGHYREALRLRPDYEAARRGLARLGR